MSKKWWQRTFPRLFINKKFKLDTKDLNEHLFVCGRSGTGKTTTMQMLLIRGVKPVSRFLVIEPSTTQYRKLKNQPELRDLVVYMVGERDSPVVFNPFYVQYGVNLDTHIDVISKWFCSSGMYGEMLGTVKNAIDAVYENKGWCRFNRTHPGLSKSSDWSSEEHFHYFPTIADLEEQIISNLHNGKYSPELKGNIEQALCTRISSMKNNPVFHSFNSFPIEKLLSENVVLELNRCQGDQLPMVMGLILIFINEHIVAQRQGKETPLKNVIVIEEAHNLIGRKESTPADIAKSNHRTDMIDLFNNMMTEWRKLGVGMIVIDQSPLRIPETVLSQTGTKIVHQLNGNKEQELIAKNLVWSTRMQGKDEKKMNAIADLKTGQFFMSRPSKDAILYKYTVGENFTEIDKHDVSDQSILLPYADIKPVVTRRKINFIATNIQNKEQLSEWALKPFMSLILLDKHELYQAADKIKFAYRQALKDIVEFNITDEVLRSFIMHNVCHKMSLMRIKGFRFPDHFGDNMIKWLGGDDSILPEIKQSLSAVGLDEKCALGFLAAFMKERKITDQAGIMRTLDKYMLSDSPNRLTEISHKISVL